jgi:hypothetical protein
LQTPVHEKRNYRSVEQGVPLLAPPNEFSNGRLGPLVVHAKSAWELFRPNDKLFRTWLAPYGTPGHDAGD